MKKSIVFVALAMVLFSASVFANEFTVASGSGGVALCDDVYNGGERGARLMYCQDIGHGKNHGCTRLYNGCQAWEGPGNGGDASCLAVCRSVYQQSSFRVPYYGQEYTRCDGPGGRRGARAVSCVDVAHGKNHGCTVQYDGCLAWEGSGNGGNAACDAVCR